MTVERQFHFVLQPFVHFWLESWADESERPLLENRYSPFRPNAAGRSLRGSKAGIQVEQSLGAPTHGQQVGQRRQRPSD